jgi:hypothetical protein
MKILFVGESILWKWSTQCYHIKRQCTARLCLDKNSFMVSAAWKNIGVNHKFSWASPQSHVLRYAQLPFFNEMQIWTVIWQIFCLQNLAMQVGNGFKTFKEVWTVSSSMGKQDKCFELLAVSFPHILSIVWYICLAIFPNLKQDLKNKQSSISASSQSNYPLKYFYIKWHLSIAKMKLQSVSNNVNCWKFPRCNLHSCNEKFSSVQINPQLNIFVSYKLVLLKQDLN